MLEQNIITEKFINFVPAAADRDSVVAEMTELFLEDGRVSDGDEYIRNVLEREAVSSTDTGIGVAIPHGKGPFVKKSAIAISRFDEGGNMGLRGDARTGRLSACRSRRCGRPCAS